MTTEKKAVNDYNKILKNQTTQHKLSSATLLSAVAYLGTSVGSIFTSATTSDALSFVAVGSIAVFAGSEISRLMLKSKNKKQSLSFIKDYGSDEEFKKEFEKSKEESSLNRKYALNITGAMSASAAIIYAMPHVIQSSATTGQAITTGIVCGFLAAHMSRNHVKKSRTIQNDRNKVVDGLLVKETLKNFEPELRLAQSINEKRMAVIPVESEKNTQERPAPPKTRKGM